MGRLIDFIETSRYMTYLIIVGNEKVKVNLNKELIIDEDELTKEVMEHPRILGFLTRVKADLIKEAKRADLNRKRIKAKRIDAIIQNGSSISGAKEKVESDKRYIVAVKEAIEAEYNRDTLEGILESFRHRKDLIQTLSANVRSEK